MKPIFQTILNTLFLTAGVLSAGFGLKGFLLPNSFIDGGVTGVSMLIAALSKVQLAFLITAINIPFIMIGFTQIGKAFAFRSTVAILGLAIAISTIDYPMVTHDKLLTAVFGGFFLGAGIGLSIRGGGVLDGTEIMALIISKKTGATIGDIILVFNIVIFTVAAFLLSVETALYSILTYLAASKTVDFIIHGVEEYNGIMIVSQKNDQIKNAIITEMKRGVTVYKGERGLTEIDQEIVFCVITRLEIPKLKKMVRTIDERAFIVINPVSDASGGVLKKTVGH